MDQADVPALLARLASDEDAVRKMAVFKLQSSINDPAFADVFISSGGLVVLRRLIMGSSGNTLAYALQSLSRLLEVDMGWEIFEGPSAGELVERVVELIVSNPLVNILRGATSILVALVSHSQAGQGRGGNTNVGEGPGGPRRGVAPATTSPLGTPVPGTFGFRALRPAVAVYPQFFELVIQQLNSADHALCANALMLINSLIRDVVSNDGYAAGASSAAAAAAAGKTPLSTATSGGEEWSKFIKRLQDLGLIKSVCMLMQSSALQDLAYPLLEFQSLTKVLLRKWREVRVDLERPEHRRALKVLHLASAPDRSRPGAAAEEAELLAPTTATGKKSSRRHNPEKWRRLGFENESPAQEFDTAGILGMMDLTDYVRKNEDGFQKLLLEQSSRPLSERCPIARASMAVTMILYDHFEVDKSDIDDMRGSQGAMAGINQRGSTDSAIQGKYSPDRIYRPLLLQWSRLHIAGLHAFFRLWKATSAERDDFDKVAELVRILVEQVVGQATRTKEVAEVEEDLLEYDCARLRELQMELLDLAFEDQWGAHLYQVRDELRHEALQFVKEQRVRCLLQGSWFSRPAPRTDGGANAATANGGGKGLGRQDSLMKKQPPVPQQQQQQQQHQHQHQERQEQPRNHKAWRFARLSHNRRYLHYADFHDRLAHDPGLEELTEKIDLGTISSVVSNVSAPSDAESEMTAKLVSGLTGGGSAVVARSPMKATTKITIYSFVDSDSARGGDSVSTPQGSTRADANGGGGGGKGHKHTASTSSSSNNHNNNNNNNTNTNTNTTNNNNNNNNNNTNTNTNNKDAENTTMTTTTTTTTTTMTTTTTTAAGGGGGGATAAGEPVPPREQAILTLFPPTHSLTSEWLDGLLMLLNQAPITAETNKLVSLVSDYGLRIRLLNVNVDAAYAGPPAGAGAVPDRDGLDEDYYYEV